MNDDSERSRIKEDPFATVPGVRPDSADSPGVAFDIRVVEGPDAGRSLVIDGTSALPLRIGTSPACDLCLTDREVSRRHVSLEIVGQRLRLLDLESTNGTFVGSLAVVGADLLGGEIVRAGSTMLLVTRTSTKAAAVLPAIAAFGRLLGASTEMRRLYPLCARLAASTVPVIIEGETGTGKEVLAESLHEQGPRAQGPFVVFDCTAVSPNLVESSLFGHERGAFTGAVTTRKGVFEQAHGGTLLIDEIGDLDLALQPKLLRALERAEVRRVGGDRPIRVDVRVLSATRRDLDRAVQAGRFRDDLFHRLAVARIELPPLRKRRGDVALLAHHFAVQLGAGSGALGSDVLRRWEDSEWPGNVRQLRNAVARQLALGELAMEGFTAAPVDEAGTDSAGVFDPPRGGDVVEEVLALDLPLVAARVRVVDEFERRYIARILAKFGGSVSRAAAASGIARRHFQRLRARGRTS